MFSPAHVRLGVWHALPGQAWPPVIVSAEKELGGSGMGPITRMRGFSFGFDQEPEDYERKQECRALQFILHH